MQRLRCCLHCYARCLCWLRIAAASTAAVVDPSGAMIANATVQAVDRAKDILLREAATGSDGLFRLQPLQPGTYTIRVRAPGIKELVQRDVVLDPSHVLDLGEMKTSLGAEQWKIGS
jgi:hypothetical protein